MRELDLFSLRLFASVCDTRNIARTAEMHHIVASAISKRLTQLEQSVGVKLLERNRHGALPTAAGETLLEHVRSILNTADRAERDMAAYGAGIRGKIRLLASVSSIAEHLPDDVAAFMNDPAHADIQVDIEEALSRDIPRQLHAGTASVGVCWDAADLSGLESRPYRSDQLCVVVHPQHPLSQEKTCNFLQTLDYEHIGLPSGTAGYALLARAAALEGREMNYRSLLSNFDAAMRVVRANLGIFVTPIEVATPYLHALGLVILPLNDTWASRRFAVCFRNGEELAPAGKMLVDFLVKRAIQQTNTPRSHFQ